MSYDSSHSDLIRCSAIYVDKILKGAQPGDLHVEESTEFELVLNLKSAKASGLTIPPSLLWRADEGAEPTKSFYQAQELVRWPIAENCKGPGESLRSPCLRGCGGLQSPKSTCLLFEVTSSDRLPADANARS